LAKPRIWLPTLRYVYKRPINAFVSQLTVLLSLRENTVQAGSYDFAGVSIHIFRVPFGCELVTDSDDTARAHYLIRNEYNARMGKGRQDIVALVCTGARDLLVPCAKYQPQTLMVGTVPGEDLCAAQAGGKAP
jgi:hypothetical protein